MKSVKYYALILVLVLGLMGGAYAVWDDVTILEGTVSTGELEVNYDDYFSTNTRGDYEGIVTVESEFVDDKTAEFTIENLFPGDGYYEDVVSINPRMINDGDVPVKLEDVEVTMTSNSGSPVWDHLMAKAHVAYQEDGEGHPGTLGYTDTVKLTEIGDEILEVADDEELVLDPGDVFALDDTIYIWLDEDAPNETQDETVVFELELTWQQWNY